MFNSSRCFGLVVFSLASVIVSCSDGRVNTLSDVAQKSRIQNTKETVVVSPKGSESSADGIAGSSGQSGELSQKDIDLVKLSVEGTLSVASLEKARLGGMTDAKIIAEASRLALSFEVESLASLGLAKLVLKQYGVGDVDGIRAMGLASVDRARAAGVSDTDIRNYARLQDIRFGERALVSLGLSKFVLSSYGTGVVDGVTAMGLASVDRARAAGLSDKEIKVYAKLQNIFFGERALISLG
jgi:hypothetical protein